MAGEDEPELVDCFRVAGAGQRRWYSMPAIVESYDEATSTAVVKPAIRLRNLRSGSAYEAKPIEVPVAWLTLDGGEVGIQGILREGDEVTLHTTDADMRASGWLASGGTVDGRGDGFKLGSSYAVPRSVSTPRRPGSTSGAFVLGRFDGTATVVIDTAEPKAVKVQASSVSLGAEASPKVAVARDGDNVLTSAGFTTWRTAVEAGILAAGGGVVAPLVGPVGAVQATSTEVESS